MRLGRILKMISLCGDRSLDILENMVLIKIKGVYSVVRISNLYLLQLVFGERFRVGHFKEDLMPVFGSNGGERAVERFLVQIRVEADNERT